ncbi:MAG: 50S ribosomal protein L17 [Bdellovibrionales bacterium]|nr:50S ribosomal protein L17 [Bdellovibrionales bacterium]
MRHRVKTHSFGRRPDARKALIRGLVDSLVEHGRIKTTVTKAKELRRHVEKAITYGKKGTVHARRVLATRYPNKSTVATIVDDLSKRFETRPGGYTRIIKIGARPGDKAEMAFIEFVDYVLPPVEDETTVKADAETEAKQKLVVKRKQDKRKRTRKLQQASRKKNFK